MVGRGTSEVAHLRDRVEVLEEAARALSERVRALEQRALEQRALEDGPRRQGRTVRQQNGKDLQ